MSGKTDYSRVEQRKLARPITSRSRVRFPPLPLARPALGEMHSCGWRRRAPHHAAAVSGRTPMEWFFIIFGFAAFVAAALWPALKVASDEDDLMGLDPLYEHNRQTS